MEEKTQAPPAQSQPEPKKKNTGMAVVAYILFFIPLLTESKNDPFVKYHTKQGFVLFLAWLITAIALQMPIIQWFFWILSIFVLVLFIMGILNAVNGKEKPLPLIGKFGDKFNF
jgi:uncharacterized membrane protein